MKITWITREEVFAGNTGAKMAIKKRIEQFANKRETEIEVFSIIEAGEFDPTANMTNIRLNYFQRQNKSTGNFLKNFFFYGLIPYTISNRINQDMITAIKKTIAQNKIEVMIFEHLHSAYYHKKLLTFIRRHHVKSVLVSHNIEFEELKSMCEFEKSFFKKAIYLMTYLLMVRYEKRIYLDNIFDQYFFLSLADMNYALTKINPKINAIYLPPGVDAHSSCFADIGEGEITVGFVGVMNFAPNIQACLFFYKEIFCNLEDKKKYLFFIIGKNPSVEIQKLAEIDNHVIVTGVVDDVSEYYKKLHVVVIPMVSGAGVKIKLYEALSFGKFVISTRKGVQGTDFEHNKHLIIADSPSEFIDVLSNYRNNEKRYKEIAKNGYDFVQSGYTWEKIGDSFYSSLECLMKIK